ncbi:MAG: substrate-binding domain-containing protein [Pseudomonadota bacterium]|nr:substrate-binding domain-containing protein [Pseudomonadota bacterium]
MRKRILSLMFGVVLICSHGSPLAGRDYVIVVGSSTVHPFASVVAERIGKTTRFRAPHIEALGSGGGLQLFCKGEGADEVDVALASRRIKPSETERCRQNGVRDIIELKIGYDGIVLASSRQGPTLKLTLKQLYLALAREVPDPEGGRTLVANPYQTWKQIDPALPEVPVKLYGPPPTSGTRDVLADRGMLSGCRQFDWLNVLGATDPDRLATLCRAVREDGVYSEAGENDNLIVRKVSHSDQAVGIFGFSFFDQNMNLLQAASIDGIEPDPETVFDNTYPLSRTLYVYAKATHLDRIAGLRAFLKEITSDRAIGEDGYLTDKGLIPLPQAERRATAEKAGNL